jgi:hypothetical protein
MSTVDTRRVLADEGSSFKEASGGFGTSRNVTSAIGWYEPKERTL